MRSQVAFRWLIACGLAILAAAAVWPSKGMLTRDIGCNTVEAGRGQEICSALSRSMEWTWLGHAILSPGWRVTWSTLRRVYCGKHLEQGDLPVLANLKTIGDWRLQDGAEGLIRLIDGRDGTSEPENSVFHPRNPDYVLKNGCGSDK